MIVFEMPCHRGHLLAHIVTVARNTKSDKIAFAVATNGKEMHGREDYNILTHNFASEYIPNEITDPWVSMVELRANANKVATKYFDYQYRIMGDHNFIFKDGWEDYILEAVDDMKRFSNLVKRPCYMGMGGAFGSYGHGRKAFIGPQPIFPCGRGIIYNMPFVWEFMERLPCAGEEQYMTSILFKRGHVPLRKMMSPIHHTMNTNRSVLDNINTDVYNPELIRQIWNDPNWMFTPKYSNTRSPPPGRYFAHCPRNAMKEMAKLKAFLLTLPGVEEFTRPDYGTKLKGKDLFT
jgi:hypothetical protein